MIMNQDGGNLFKRRRTAAPLFPAATHREVNREGQGHHPHLKKLKLAGQKICMVTAYDATFARILDEAGADVLLVGDSLGMVVQGNDSTLPVTMEQMIYHARAGRQGRQAGARGRRSAFMSYQSSVDEAVKNAGRMIARARRTA